MKSWKNIIGMMALGSLAAACTEVELCYEAHPHRTYLDFRFNWADEYKDVHSGKMRVIAVRPINILRYEFQVDAGEENNRGTMLLPEDEAEECRRLMQNLSLISPGGFGSNLWVRSGEYNFVTYAWDDNVLSDETGRLGYTDEEQESLGSGFRHLPLSYKPFPVTAPQVRGRYGDWIDYNPYSEYISSFGMPIFYAYADHVNVPVPKEGSGLVQVDFTPELATQRVTFRFNIEKTQDVIVDSLVAEIAGIPSTIDLTSGVITADKTYKILFQPEYPSLSTTADSASVTRLACEGTVDVTGVMRSYSDDMITGPGILQLGIYARVKDESEPRTVYKLYRAGINLYHTLKAQPSLKWDEEVQGYRQTGRTLVLSINEALKVTRDGVMNEGSAGTGLDSWEKGESADVEI